jgi:hypothetical protein
MVFDVFVCGLESSVHVDACLSALSPGRGRPNHQLGEVTEKNEIHNVSQPVLSEPHG